MTTGRSERYSRRALLKGLGVGMGLLPLLNSEKAIGQAAAFPKRLISVTWTNGIIPADFFPPAGPLTGTLPPILAPLELWKAKILAMRGAGSGTATGAIDCKVMVDVGQLYSGHNSYPSLLTGTAVAPLAGRTTSGGPSIDTLIADQLKMQGFAAPQLNVGCRPYASSTSWRANGVKNTAETDPYRLYSKLFPAGSTTPQTDRLLARRQSVIDFCLDDLTRFVSGLGTEDRAKVDVHLDSIRAIEKQLVPPPIPRNPACAPPPNTPAGLSFTPAANYPLHVKLMMDLVAAAVKCDLARTITIDLIDDGGGNSLTFPWLDIPTPDYHSIAHAGAAAYPQKRAIDTWYYAQVASLIAQLVASPEGAATSLDNCVVLVCNGMNEGATSAVTSLPYLIVGSGGGFFKQGTCVQFPVNVPNNQLLTSVCHAMDLQIPSVGMTYPGDLDAALKA